MSYDTLRLIDGRIVATKPSVFSDNGIKALKMSRGPLGYGVQMWEAGSGGLKMSFMCDTLEIAMRTFLDLWTDDGEARLRKEFWQDWLARGEVIPSFEAIRACQDE